MCCTRRSSANSRPAGRYAADTREIEVKVYRVGEKGRALCESDGRVFTTYRYRNVLFSDGTGVARKILAGVCDRCGEVVSISAQSAPSIKAAREAIRRRRAGDRLLAIAPALEAAGVPRMTDEEIHAEVKAVRAARRRRTVRKHAG